jgi:hypothetical protein
MIGILMGYNRRLRQKVEYKENWFLKKGRKWNDAHWFLAPPKEGKGSLLRE